MRPVLSELCDIDPRELRLLSYEEASAKIIQALKKEKEKLSVELDKILNDTVKDYDKLSPINYKIMYLDKAIEARNQDYLEMFQ